MFFYFDTLTLCVFRDFSVVLASVDVALCISSHVAWSARTSPAHPRVAVGIVQLPVAARAAVAACVHVHAPQSLLSVAHQPPKDGVRGAVLLSSRRLCLSIVERLTLCLNIAAPLSSSVLAIAFKCTVVGERLSPYVAAALVFMGLQLLMT